MRHSATQGSALSGSIQAVAQGGEVRMDRRVIGLQFDAVSDLWRVTRGKPRRFDRILPGQACDFLRPDAGPRLHARSLKNAQAA